MTKKDQNLPNTLFSFIWYFLKDFKLTVIIATLLSLLAGFWGPFNSMLIKQIINLLPSAQNNISILTVPVSLIFINFIVLDNFTWRGITYIRSKLIPIVIDDIIVTLMNHSLKKSHQFYQEHLSGKISGKILNLADGIRVIISNSIPNFLRGTSLLLMAFIAAYSVNFIFCLILMIWFILFIGISILMSKKLALLSLKVAKAQSILAGELVDTISNHNNIKTFSRNSYEEERLVPFIEKQQKAYTEKHSYALVTHSIQGGLIAIMVACSGFFLTYLYGKGLISTGDFALILSLSMETGHMMWFTMIETYEFSKEVARCIQCLNTLIIPLEIVDKPDATSLICTRGQITFNNVFFNYTNTESLFKNLSIEIKPGEKVGLVGYSGSGKSTFVNLLLRFYELTGGTILIDNQDISNVTQKSLREKIAFIPQDPSLFQRTLMENIRYGKIEATDEDVIEAAKKAHAHEFIEKLPEGYNALVGERGIKLSGGQRQRIAIARAFLKNSPILILDEATSQLDSVTESLIQESLQELIQNKTTIIIAHRLSTLLHMDRILVFDKGNIIENGTHEELVTKNGLYKNLWDAQVGGFLGDGSFKVEK